MVAVVPAHHALEGLQHRLDLPALHLARVAGDLVDGERVVAVDPRVIPFRTRMWVPGYGFGVAADTGSDIQGHRIDVGFDAYWEAVRWGRRSVTVYVLP